MGIKKEETYGFIPTSRDLIHKRRVRSLSISKFLWFYQVNLDSTGQKRGLAIPCPSSRHHFGIRVGDQLVSVFLRTFEILLLWICKLDS